MKNKATIQVANVAVNSALLHAQYNAVKQLHKLFLGLRVVCPNPFPCPPFTLGSCLSQWRRVETLWMYSCLVCWGFFFPQLDWIQALFTTQHPGSILKREELISLLVSSGYLLLWQLRMLMNLFMCWEFGCYCHPYFIDGEFKSEWLKQKTGVISEFGGPKMRYPGTGNLEWLCSFL